MGRRALVLVVALLLAGVAAFAIFQYLQGIEAEILEGQEQVRVYRAGQTLAEGTEGTFVLQGPGTLFIESFEQRQDLPVDAITSEEELRSVLSGRVAAGPISQNSILNRSQWVTVTVQITPLAELIPEGKQAITVAPGAVQGVSGFVRPGDRVNIIITLDIEFSLTALAEEPEFGIPVEEEEETEEGEAAGTRTVTYTRYVLQGLPVMAVGQQIRPDEAAPATVEADGGEAEGTAQTGEAAALSTVFTLEVTPEQAERLVFAQNSGSLYFTLVPEDFVEVVTRGVTIETLFEGDLVEDIFGN